MGLLLPGASHAKRSNMIHADHAAIFYLKLHWQCYINKRPTPHKKIKLTYPSMFKPGKSPLEVSTGKSSTNIQMGISHVDMFDD